MPKIITTSSKSMAREGMTSTVTPPLFRLRKAAWLSIPWESKTCYRVWMKWIFFFATRMRQITIIAMTGLSPPPGGLNIIIVQRLPRPRPLRQRLLRLDSWLSPVSSHPLVALPIVATPPPPPPREFASVTMSSSRETRESSSLSRCPQSCLCSSSRCSLEPPLPLPPWLQSLSELKIYT